jgi:hypothetical protein
MASVVDSSPFLTCQRISTSMSLVQASSGAMDWISTVSPLRSGETTLATIHFG